MRSRAGCISSGPYRDGPHRPLGHCGRPGLGASRHLERFTPGAGRRSARAAARRGPPLGAGRRSARAAHSARDGSRTSAGGRTSTAGYAPPMTRWWERLPDPVGAGGLLVMALVPGMSGIGADLPEFPDRPLDALGWFLVVALCAPLAIRRRWPAACTVLTAVPFGLYQCLGYAHSAATLGFPFALYALGAHQSRRRAVLPVVLTVAYAGLAVLLHRMGSGQNVVQYAEFGALLAAFWLAGRWMRRQREAAEQHRRDSMALAAAAERSVIARELHDVVTHHVTAMVLQADAAAMALDIGTAAMALDVGTAAMAPDVGTAAMAPDASTSPARDRSAPTDNAAAHTDGSPPRASNGQAPDHGAPRTDHVAAHLGSGQAVTGSGQTIAGRGSAPAATGPTLADHDRPPATDPTLTDHDRPATTDPTLTDHDRPATAGPTLTDHHRARTNGPTLAGHDRPATASPTLGDHDRAPTNGGRPIAKDDPVLGESGLPLAHDGLALVGDSLAAVAGTGRQALVELRHLLRVLDADQNDPSTRPVVGRIADLVERTRTLGQPVDWREEGIARPAGGGVDLTVYRVVQESLTNAVKYAHGRPTRVRIAHSDDRVAVEVHTDGSTVVDGGATRTGRGLAGLHERVSVFGGDFEAGPTPTGGFLIRASIPTGVRT
ncbi:DUF7134 domain-containing protein [Dactylosporangium sp. CA-052675]|uniref:sensor histidine kinase n=1 Tax=Dactylosporangium sp. CA-052675 TaxID=3239927 RepID=UPI003D90ED79